MVEKENVFNPYPKLVGISCKKIEQDE